MLKLWLGAGEVPPTTAADPLPAGAGGDAGTAAMLMPLSDSEGETAEEEDLESIEGLHQSITRQRSRLGKLMGRVESLQSLAASLENDDVRPRGHCAALDPAPVDTQSILQDSACTYPRVKSHALQVIGDSASSCASNCS